MSNTLANLHSQLDIVTNGSTEIRIEAFGTDGDYKVYTPRKPKGSIHRKVLFIGTGRCGTTTIANMFQNNGIDIKHEVDGLDGISSHWFAYDSDWHPYVIGQPLGHIHLGEHRSDYQFEHVLHVVRNPLDCIPSIMTFFHDSDYEFLQEQGIKDIKRNDLRSAMKIYYEVNLRCHKTRTSKRVIQIENIFLNFENLCLDLFGTAPSVVTYEKANGSKHNRLAWDDIYNTDWELGYALSLLALDYGYAEDLKGTRYDLPNYQII